MGRSRAPAFRGDAYAAVLDHAFPGGGVHLAATAELLRAPPIDEEAARLDGHARQTRRYVGAVERALATLDARAVLSLQAARTYEPAGPAELPLADRTATWVTGVLRRWPAEAAELAVATGRLVEETWALMPDNRRKVPLGRGFAAQLERRMRLRLPLLMDDPSLVAALERNRELLLEAPDVGVAEVERAVGRALTAEERDWVDAERFAGMLEVARSNSRKTEGGHIRRFLRRDETHGVVLDRYGAHGHWLIAGRADAQVLARAGTIAARLAGDRDDPATSGWKALVLEGADRPAGQASPRLSAPIELDEAHRCIAGDEAVTVGAIRDGLSQAAHDDAAAAILAAGAGRPSPRRLRRRSYVLTVAGGELRLTSAGGAPGRRPLCTVALDAGDDELLDFLDVVGRVADAARITDRIDPVHDAGETVRWTRGLLAGLGRPRPVTSGGELSETTVRLVYVPASQPHPLGGVPLIGLRYVSDHLERLGARTDVVTIAERDMRRRLVELLGADVIGISVYLTNRPQVAALVHLLREAGYAGKIVLGGPELREIDEIQASVTGWDALVRGEGEEAFPQVLRVLRHLDAGETAEALRLARSLAGVAISHGDLVILADTATRNGAAQIRCPLPFEWRRYSEDRTLKMNFTRGCPYRCGFCPNHQGQKHHSCGPDEMWAFLERAAADALRLPAADEDRCATAIQEALGIAGPPRLRPALDVMLRARVPRDLIERICGRPAPPEASGPASATPWVAKAMWLDRKAEELQRLAPDEVHPTLEPFEIMTSEDNTLVNRRDVLEFLRRRRGSAWARQIVFNPGQNTVRDLTDHKGAIHAEYVDALVDSNRFRIVFGVDGTSNPVLRQNGKPYYSIGEAVDVNRALERRGVETLNNYILLTPETDLAEAIEAFALFVLLPIRWRDHGEAINLRIIKEPGTRSHDEGLLYAPEDESYEDPFRFPAVVGLLRRWDLTPSVHSAALPDLLWRILREDEDARSLLPRVVRRWERDFDRDPFLVNLAGRVRRAEAGAPALVDALEVVAAELRAGWLLEAEVRADAVAEELQVTVTAGRDLPMAARRRAVAETPEPLPSAPPSQA